MLIKNSEIWNPWHGCVKYSEGCKNCYVYRTDGRYEKDASNVQKTANFNLPVKKNRSGEYKFPSGTFFYTCFTSDFLLDIADGWRDEAFSFMRERSDCRFLFLTKRIERLMNVLPHDWGNGWDNVIIGSTCENQRAVDFRLPIFKELPIKHKVLIHEPLLEEITIAKYLDGIEEVVAGGESGNEARPCNYDWIKKIQAECQAAKVDFTFKQTGANFIKDGKHYHVERKFQHSQARKAGINLRFGKIDNE